MKMFSAQSRPSIAIYILIFVHTTEGRFVYPNERASYEYEAYVKSSLGGNPVSSSNLEVKAELVVTGFENYVIARLSNVSSRVHVDGESSVESTNHSETFHRPFAILYDGNGKTSGVLVHPKDTTWSMNIKKAIGSIFQLDVDLIKTGKEQPHGFSSNESTPYGKCLVFNNVVPKAKGRYYIIKQMESADCQESQWREPFDIGLDPCTKEGDRASPISASLDREYIGDYNFSGKFHVDKIDSLNVVAFTPFDGSSDSFLVSVTQIFTRTNLMRVHIHKSVINESYISQGVVANFSKRIDYSGKTHDFEKITTSVKQDLANIEEFLISKLLTIEGSIVLMDSTESLQGILEKLRSLKERYLHGLYDDLSKQKSSRDILKLYIGILPLIGTAESIKMISKLILHHREEVEFYSNGMLKNVVENMAFHINDPDANIVTILKPLLKIDFKDQPKDLTISIILAVASVLSKAVRLYPKNKIVQAPINYIMHKFITSTDYEKKMIYLNALNNIKSPKVIALLEEIIAESINVTSHLQALAIDSLRDEHSRNLTFIETDYWPILLNKSKSIEVRAAALKTIMARPTSYRMFNKFLKYIKYDDEKTLYELFITRIDSLAATTLSCHKRISQEAQKLIRRTIEMARRKYFINDWTFDYYNEHLNIGSGFKTQIVGNVFEDGFLSVTLEMSPRLKLKKWNFDTINVYGRLTECPLIDSDFIRMSYVQQILETFTSQKLNFDVTLYNGGKATKIIHFNSPKDIDEYFMPLNFTTFAENNFSNAYYSVGMDYEKEVTVPTDMGLPVVIFMKAPFIRRNDILFRSKFMEYILNVNAVGVDYFVQGIKVFDPFTKNWLGSKRVQKSIANVPFDIYYFHPLKVLFKNHEIGTVNSLGYRSFSSSFVFVQDESVYGEKSIDFSKLTTPYEDQEKVLLDLNIEYLGLWYKSKFVGSQDCISDYRINKMKDLFIDGDSKNYGTNSVIRMILSVHQLWLQSFVTHAEGNCEFSQYVMADHEETECSVVFLDMNEIQPDDNSGIVSDESFVIKCNMFNLGVTSNRYWVLNFTESETLMTDEHKIVKFTYSKAHVNKSLCFFSERFWRGSSVKSQIKIYIGDDDKNACPYENFVKINSTYIISDEQRHHPAMGDLYKERAAKSDTLEGLTEVTKFRLQEYDITYKIHGLSNNDKQIINYISSLVENLIPDYSSSFGEGNPLMKEGSVKVDLMQPVGKDEILLELSHKEISLNISTVPMEITDKITAFLPAYARIKYLLGSIEVCRFGSDGYRNVYDEFFEYTRSQGNPRRYVGKCIEGNCAWELQGLHTNGSHHLRITAYGETLNVRNKRLSLNGENLKRDGDRYYFEKWFNYAYFEEYLLIYLKFIEINIFLSDDIEFHIPKSDYVGLCFDSLKIKF